MANMASVSYAIEGPQKDLEEILGAICLAIAKKDNRYEEYKACEYLGFVEKELERSSLGGEIEEEPEIKDGVLRFCAEERWGRQDFCNLLQERFPDIKVYWVVEEADCEVYCTNDKVGKYFPDRYYADVCIDGVYESEYFITEESMWNWLTQIAFCGIRSMEDVERFNADYEDSDINDENFIQIHKFEILDGI